MTNKLNLNPEPTFSIPVRFPVPGSAPVPVRLTFKHRDRTELEAFVKPGKKRTDAEMFMQMVEGWELDDAFTKKNVDILLAKYMGIALTTFEAYIDELTGRTSMGVLRI